jgi:outer membrane lipoprotein
MYYKVKGGIMNKTISYPILVILLLAAYSCAPKIPKSVLSNVDKSITFNMLITNPSEYTGKTVITGGEIISAINQSNGDTRIGILEFPLDNDYKPQKGDRSKGRFIVLYRGYLETKIFRPGRLVTVVGTVGETKKGTIGSMSYTFPVINSTYVKLWPAKQHNPMPIYPIGSGFSYAPYMLPPWGYYPYEPLGD